MRLRGVGNDEREQTLNQLLTELDGFDSDKDHTVICIAATNRYVCVCVYGCACVVLVWVLCVLGARPRARVCVCAARFPGS